MPKLILSIESSCDDSSIAVSDADSLKLLFHQKISQECDHSAYGGVVPELASRLHAATLPQILSLAEPYFRDLCAIAVTSEPGLNVTLLEGVMVAKTLCFALNLPLIAINHLKGHLYSLFLEREAIFPLGVLLVSGGHTMLLEARDFGQIEIVAQSLDDSFGESFDKVAKMLGLGYPGGPVVERLARSGADRFGFTVPLKSKAQFAFSFSGLKNAVRLAVSEELRALGLDEADFKQTLSMDSKLTPRSWFCQAFCADICASFQTAATTHLLDKCKIFFERNNSADKAAQWRHFGVVGGASANLFLRGQLQALCDNYGVNLLTAPLEFCSDNAAMIGRVAVENYRRSIFACVESLQTRPRIDKF